MNSSAAASKGSAFATLEHLLRVYPPNPRLRAPQRPGDWLYVDNRPGPPAGSQEGVAPLDFSGSPYAAEIRRWRTEARRRMLAEAFAWSSAYRDGLPAAPEGAALLLAGHQPEFFHPGVWFKNFLLDRERREAASPVVPVNVVIDYDLCSKRNVLHPAIDDAGVRLESIDVDLPAIPLPQERATIVDRQFLATFPERLRTFRREKWSGGGVPIAAPLFEASRERVDSAETYGQFASIARHRFEERLCLSTLEIPFSRLAEEDSFREFVWLLLREGESFRAAYNAALGAVRRVQKLRSKTHPAPDLVERDGWIEAPFWIWTNEDPRRRRLFARSTNCAGGVEISDLNELRESLGGDDDPRIGAERLAELSSRGIAVRPRALTATIWMRMVLSDAFLHGIGGGKYDQAADLLMSAWFDVRPPAYRIATATFNLTDQTPEATAAALAERRRVLRDLTQHPERRLSGDAPSDAVRAAEELAETLCTMAKSGSNAELHRRSTSAREVLAEAVEEQRASTHREIERLERELRDRKILDSRERSFLLFDERTLPQRLREAAEQAVRDRKPSSSPVRASVEATPENR